MPYSPSATRSELRPRFRVGIRLIDWAHGYASRIFVGIISFLRGRAEWELVYDAPSGHDLPPTPINADWEGDGLIVFRHTAEEAECWRSRGIRVVNLSTESPAGLHPFPRVTLDNRAVALAAFDHLAGDLGLRDLAYWHDPDRLYSCERWDAFDRFSREAGCRSHLIEVPASRHPPEVRSKRIEEAAWTQLVKLPQPAGLFAKDDIAGVWALRLCQLTGLCCPSDLAVVAVADDPIFCHIAAVPLSSVRFPGRQVGYVAAELLQGLMAGDVQDTGQRIRVPPGPVVPRDSSGLPDPGDPVVAKALDAIRATPPARAMGVRELCDQIGISREQLRLRMQTAIGSSPKEQIDHVRLMRLKMALATRNENLETLAHDFSFSSSGELCRFFKRLTGISPGTYRKRMYSPR